MSFEPTTQHIEMWKRRFIDLTEIIPRCTDPKMKEILEYRKRCVSGLIDGVTNDYKGKDV